jgi:glycoprotein endo-alpha-1,2-mannosidase
MLGLWLDAGNGEDLVEAGFDGFYTYFAADGFSFGSTSRNWKRMCAFARQHALACTLSVGPGYQDDKIRPWNQANTRARKEGEYYDSMWLRAVEAGAEVTNDCTLIINALV